MIEIVEATIIIVIMVTAIFTVAMVIFTGRRHPRRHKVDKASDSSPAEVVVKSDAKPCGENNVRINKRIMKEVNTILQAAQHLAPGGELKITCLRWPGHRAIRLLRELHGIECNILPRANGQKYCAIKRITSTEASHNV